MKTFSTWEATRSWPPGSFLSCALVLALRFLSEQCSTIPLSVR